MCAGAIPTIYPTVRLFSGGCIVTAMHSWRRLRQKYGTCSWKRGLCWNDLTQ